MPELRGLIVDWGGVLTAALQDCMRAWCEADGIDYAAFRSVLRQWLADLGPVDNPMHGLERGELAPAEFERALGARLTTRDGRPVESAGLLERMFAAFDHDHGMAGVVRRAHQAGLRTALCSNSWGNEYPRESWAGLFDAVVISGEVGMRKPEPRIYVHTARAIGLVPEQCAFVDDLPQNVRGAVATGMVGVLHVSTERTTEELEALFGLRLREPA
ncbi:MAG: HAD family hydrolase [Frankiaceae bacterium]